MATFRETGADTLVATVYHFASGVMAASLSSSDSAGPNRACIVGTKGRIEINQVWYSPTSVRVYDNDNTVVDHFDGAVEGPGMQFQAVGAQRVIAAGLTESPLISPAQTVKIWPHCTITVPRSVCVIPAKSDVVRARIDL